MLAKKEHRLNIVFEITAKSNPICMHRVKSASGRVLHVTLGQKQEEHT